VHGVGAVRGAEFDSQSDAYEALKAWGLPTSTKYKVVTKEKGVREFIQYYLDHRHDVEHEIDGTVIKVNERSAQSAL